MPGYLARLINSLGTHRLELAVGFSTAMAIIILYGWSGTRLNLQGGLALGVLGILTAMVMAVLLFEVAIETWRLDRNQSSLSSVDAGGKVMDGSHSLGDAAEWKWHLEAQREP